MECKWNFNGMLNTIILDVSVLLEKSVLAKMAVCQVKFFLEFLINCRDAKTKTWLMLVFEHNENIAQAMLGQPNHG